MNDNYLYIKVGDEQSHDGFVSAEYYLKASFNNTALMSGSVEVCAYTFLGQIIWNSILKLINDIVELYVSSPKLGCNFLDDLSIKLEFADTYSLEELRGSYMHYVENVGKLDAEKEIRKLLSLLKSNHFTDLTVNGFDFNCIIK